MEFNCHQIVERYILNQNPLYAFSFPLSLLLAIIIFGVSKAYKWSDNSYVIQILIPILTFFLSMVIIDIISRAMISKKEKARLLELCSLWMHDPEVKNNPLLNKIIDMDLVANYEGKYEKFSNLDNSLPLANFSDSINPVPAKINNPNIVSKENVLANDPTSSLSPYPIRAKENGKICIENSNGCNLCSGTNDNPYNIIAPIPGPMWMPQSAEAVQNRLKNNNYTNAKCAVN